LEPFKNKISSKDDFHIIFPMGVHNVSEGSALEKGKKEHPDKWYGGYANSKPQTGLSGPSNCTYLLL
jgi:hypothetical protein